MDLPSLVNPLGKHLHKYTQKCVLLISYVLLNPTCSKIKTIAIMESVQLIYFFLNKQVFLYWMNPSTFMHIYESLVGDVHCEYVVLTYEFLFTHLKLDFEKLDFSILVKCNFINLFLQRKIINNNYCVLLRKY
jgi:hypothetical protein